MSDPAAKPDAPDGEIDFPEVRQSRIGSDQLAAYFDDLRQVADVQEVRLKAGARDKAGDATAGLERARSLLLAGEVRGIQIRYVWQGEAWWDTLIRKSRDVEMTRVQPPSIEEMD